MIRHTIMVVGQPVKAVTYLQASKAIDFIFNHPMFTSALTELFLYPLIKSVAYSSQGSHAGQLDFCN